MWGGGQRAMEVKRRETERAEIVEKDRSDKGVKERKQMKDTGARRMLGKGYVCYGRWG